MADNLKSRGGRDRERMYVNQDYERRDWSKKLGVSEDRLKEAVEAVGDQAEKVEHHLKRGVVGHNGTDRVKRKPARQAGDRA